tara:strand:+ start:279 stop:464 length:186 start_codon:yes stop_codon:yes gene_type:complete
MAKKNKKEMVEEVEEEVLKEEPVPEPTPEPQPQGRIVKKKVEGIGFTLVTYDNGEFEKVYH